MKKTIFLLFVFSLMLFFSCRKENERPSWDTELLAPLVNAKLNLNNLVSNSVIQTNADSSLKIVYQNDIYGLSMDTLFRINDTTLSNSYELPITQTVGVGGTIFPYTVTPTTYQLPGVQLRTVIIKTGKVKYTIRSKIHEVTVFDYSIPSATLNGNPFVIHINVPACVGNTPGIFSQVYDLAGYTLDLTGQAQNQVNTIYTSLQATVSPTAAGPVTINPQDSLIIDNQFYELFPYYARGYFGQNTINIGPSLSSFNMFNRIVAGTLGLENVNFDFKIENPIGLDARMVISNLSSYNSRTKHVVSLNNSLINSPININRASESNPGTGVVYPTYANFPLNTGNSNIKQMIENLPDALGYSLQIVTNPLGNISGSNDFIYSDQLLKAQLNMEIPLSLVATNLTLQDTLALNISNSNGVQDVHSGTITLFANNGFPFDASMQMYLLNDQNVVTDSIFGYINTIDEAPINASLRATGKKLTKLVIPMSQSKMSLLYAAKRMVLKVKFNTSAQPNYIKIYSDYSIDVNIVGDFNYTVHL